MEDGNKAHFRPQVLGICGQLLEGLRGGPEKNRVQDVLISQGQGSQGLRDGEHEMKILGGE